MTNTETAGAGTHSDRPMQHDEALRRAGMVAIRIGREGDIQAAETVRAQIARIQALEADNQTLRTGYAAARLEIESLRGRVGVVPAPRSVTEPTQVELDAFILRAGFRPGWENLESWARRMAEQAVREINEARAMRAAQPATADDRAAFKAYLEDCDECAIVPDIAGAFHAGWTSRVRAAQPAGAQQPGAAYAALPDECDSPEICAISKTCAGQFGTKRICASHGQAPAQAAPAAVAGPSEMPTVPDSVLAYVHAYGDSRADEDGLSGLRISELILALRRWAKSIAAAPTTQPAHQQEAADALARAEYYIDNPSAWSSFDQCISDDISAVTEALRAALAAPKPQQEAQEPVAWYEYNADLDAWFLAYSRNPNAKTRPLVFGDTFSQPSPASQGDALDAARLDWLLWKLPGDAIRYVVGELADTSDAAEFRAAIDAARAAQESSSHG